MNNPLAGLGSAPSPTKRGNYFDTPGDHFVTVEDCKIIESQLDGRNFFVATCTINKSQSYSEGEERTWMVDLSKRSAKSNIKGFVAAALSKDIDEVEDSDGQKILQDGIANGATVLARATNITTKAGHPFTLVNWKAV